WYAWGINTVEYYMTGRRPDWDSILAGKEDRVYPLNVAFVPDDIDMSEVRDIDYDGFESNYANILSLRKMDYRKYRVFAFVFSETDESNRHEIEKMLKADMRPYVIT
ncbi:MAG TPA: hypothetical protein VLA34_06725, partial [Candidatus Krumholzibacterium sp.]|nr:hypothetical protein [Candidatus Krumholzibacterium sp.]